MARSTSTTFSDKLTFPDDPTSDDPTSDDPTSDDPTSDEPTSDELTSSPSRATSTSTIKREEKEKPRHSDSRLDDGQELDGRQDGGPALTMGYQAARSEFLIFARRNKGRNERAANVRFVAIPSAMKHVLR